MSSDSPQQESPYGTRCRVCGSANLTQDPDEPRVADCADCGSFNIGPDSENEKERPE